MKRLLLALAFLLGGLVEVGAQSSVQGGGLSTKAIQALEECFDSADNFTCGGGSPAPGSSNVTIVNPPGGTGSKVARFEAIGGSGKTKIVDGSLFDDATGSFSCTSASGCVELRWTATGTDIPMALRNFSTGSDADIDLVANDDFRVQADFDSDGGVVDISNALGGTSPFGLSAGGDLSMCAGGCATGATELDLDGVPATSASGALLELRGDFNNPGAGQTVVGLQINVDPIDVAAGTVYGLHIPTQDSDDSSEQGAALAIGDWSGGNPLRDVIFTKSLGNSEIASNTGLNWILDEDNTQGVNTQVFWNESTTAVTSLVNYDFSAQIGTMNGSDTYVGLQLNAFQSTNPTGSGNNVRMFAADSIVNRSGAVQTSFFTHTGYDYFAQMFAGTTTPPDPGTNTVGFFIDEGTDRVGGGGNDCALVARLSDGTELNIAILVTDGGCP